jgi:predicted nucleic acid-binding protein
MTGARGLPEEEKEGERWCGRRRLSEEEWQLAEAADRFVRNVWDRRPSENTVEESQHPALLSVVVDTSVLVGQNRKAIVAAAALGYYKGFSSGFIISEFMRVWLELAALKIGLSSATMEEAARRLHVTWERTSAVVADLLRLFTSVDYREAPNADLSWLRDRDDQAIMQTALAANADILVSDNSKDFPLGEERCGVRILNADQFLEVLYRLYPESESEITDYLRRGK